MQIKATIVLGVGLLLAALPVFAGPPADAGVTRTEVVGSDNWGWQGGPSANPNIWCPGGTLMQPFDCSDSMTGRLHFRDGVGWSCTDSNDARMRGVGLYTSNGNFDADSNGPVWGEFKIVPMEDCNKDAVYSEVYEDFVNEATSFWYGTWNGKRQFDPDKNAWIGDIKFIAKGVGEGLDGLHFKGLMWITTFTPFPMPYEYIFPMGSDEFNMPEATFIGTIQD